MTMPALTVVLLAAPAAAEHMYVDTDTLIRLVQAL